jgi:hypothetical protein
MKRLRHQRPRLGIGLIMALAIGTVAGVNRRPQNDSHSCDFTPRGPSSAPPRQEDRLLFVCAGGKPKMKEDHQLATAMLAIAFAAVMLVVGQLYIEKRSDRLPAAQPR